MSSSEGPGGNSAANITGTSGLASDKKTPANANIGAEKPGMFDKEGAVGKQFTTEGAIGGTAEKIGGPLSSEGAIGKQFTDQGAVGGTVQDKLGGSGKSN